ncbi:hypothetical protein BJI67_00555 [Acidihalobacter aeolianus]|uniref:DUF1641 domain-containing protein n=1 Tax=Acidihalobacter aeolianus TaxID=2792603 RepID=A0A1D8K466_9GAMM|nr:hypothetical protein [Acidihalobacter aeolianus]AOV15748.1 hypothetical protein BJI67_00555 [Acidihalobacter aeolianus]
MTETADKTADTRTRIDALVGELVDNGDLDSLVHLARLVGAAQDALTDDMVGRLAGIAGDGLDMLDRVNRSGVIRALPAIAAMVDNGDLERITHLARLLGSAEDALTDDMIGRLAGLAADGLALADRVTRSPAVPHLLALLERDGVLDTLATLLEGLGAARAELRSAPPSSGGLGEMLRVARDPQTLDALRLMTGLASQLRK